MSLGVRILALLILLDQLIVGIPGFGQESGSQPSSTPTISANSQNAPTILPATETNAAETAVGRVFSPNDVVSVKVYQEDDLNAKVTVDKNGMIMLPLLGPVKIGGMTIEQATTQIQALYGKDYLVDPHVNLTLEQFAQRRFTVLGEVHAPGSYDFPQGESVNLLEAIATAGGFTRLGESSKVIVQRTENSTSKIFRLNADEMTRNQKTRPFEIKPNDIITVTEKAF